MSKRKARNERVRTIDSFLRMLVTVAAVALAVSLVYLAGRHLLAAYSKHQRDTVLAQYGVIEQKLSGEALVLRRDKVFGGRAGGFFDYLVNDGSKFGINTPLGYYLSLGEKSTLRAAASGLFTRRIDGLEEVLQNIQLSAVGPETFAYRIQQHDPATEFKPGQGVYKIVDNLAPTRFLLQFTQHQDNPALEPGQTVSLQVNERVLGKCRVIASKQDFEKLVVLVETPHFREELLHIRQAEAVLTVSSPQGYLVPEKSLLVKGKEKGIYCLNGEEVICKPVRVLAVKDGIAVVEGLQPTTW
jgi:putative membrane fusion protein